MEDPFSGLEMVVIHCRGLGLDAGEAAGVSDGLWERNEPLLSRASRGASGIRGAGRSMIGACCMDSSSCCTWDPGDSYDNSMAETLNGTCKAELVKLHDPGELARSLRSRSSNGSIGTTQPVCTTRSATSTPDVNRRRRVRHVAHHHQCRPSPLPAEPTARPPSGRRRGVRRGTAGANS